MKKILITGASSGFGKSLVNELSKDYFVIAVSRRLKKMKNIFSKKKILNFIKLIYQIKKTC